MSTSSDGKRGGTGRNIVDGVKIQERMVHPNRLPGDSGRPGAHADRAHIDTLGFAPEPAPQVVEAPVPSHLGAGSLGAVQPLGA